MPPIIYIANKAEDGFEGEVLQDFYRKFPRVAATTDPLTQKPIEPLFISAEHGDGLQDLFEKIGKLIPEQRQIELRARKQKRVERYLEYKNLLLDEIVTLKKEEIERDSAIEARKSKEPVADYTEELREFVDSWQREFDAANSNPEECSDFDSDNEINPLDTLDSLGRYVSSSKKSTVLSSDNQQRRKPI